MSTPTTFPTWQTLMDRAYTQWYSTDLNYIDFLKTLKGAKKDAVLLGTLTAQVNNGGFLQWVDNGYGLAIEQVIHTLKKVGSPSADEVAYMVSQLEEYIDTDKTCHGCMENYWIMDTLTYPEWDWDEEEEYEEEEEYCAGHDIAEQNDSRFYALHDAFTASVEAWFCAGRPDNSHKPKAPVQSPTPSHPSPNTAGNAQGPRYPNITVTAAEIRVLAQSIPIFQ